MFKNDLSPAGDSSRILVQFVTMRAKKITLGFIGAGRVGTGLATGFARAGLDVVAIASRKIASAQKLAKRVRGARVCAPQEVADRADIVFLTVPDDAIEAVAASVKWRAGSACVHCSGAAELDALKKAVADGALAGGFHPLHMFGEAGEPPGALAGSAIALAGPDALVKRLERLARALEAKPLRLPEGGHALYHAAANFSGAFVIALMQETIALWSKLGIPQADALAALLPLLRGTADNVEKLGAAGGLGSAVARGDVGTIRRHLDVLAREAPDSLELYRILSLRTIPLALEKGTLEPEVAKEITALLLAHRTARR
jgi:predicted short-subunit dehydrogenase-like oxidoreductase (DUF2520 family)